MVRGCGGLVYFLVCLQVFECTVPAVVGETPACVYVCVCVCVCMLWVELCV